MFSSRYIEQKGYVALLDTLVVGNVRPSPCSSGQRKRSRPKNRFQSGRGLADTSGEPLGSGADAGERELTLSPGTSGSRLADSVDPLFTGTGSAVAIAF